MTPACALWVVRAPAAPRADHLALLSASERETAARFRHAERRARYACGRALLRQALSGRLGVPPGELDIAAGRHGRPGLAKASREAFPDVDFNLSSTAGLVACVVATGLRVGVDIEAADRAPGRTMDRTALEARVLSRAERRWLERQADRSAGFHRLWTLKEAVAKAEGRGLGLPFDLLSLPPGRDGTIKADLTALEVMQPRHAGADGTEPPREAGGTIAAHTGDWLLFSFEADAPLALAVFGHVPAHAMPDLAPTLPEPALFEPVTIRLLARSG